MIRIKDAGYPDRSSEISSVAWYQRFRSANRISLQMGRGGLKNGSNQRDAKWTQSLAVGDEEFVMRTKAKLGVKAIGRRGVKNVGGYELEESQSPYMRFFTLKSAA